jgi:hypothetical protein
MANFTFPTTTEDVLASTDVLNVVANASDSMTPEECVEFRIACEKVMKVARDTIGLLNTQLVKILDGQPAIIREGRKFYIGYKSKSERTDHDLVAKHVVGVALDVAREMDVSGPDPEPAELIVIGAKAATKIMTDLYLAPSTDVKKGQLDRYGIPRSVIDVQRGVKEVKEVPAGGEPET